MRAVTGKPIKCCGVGEKLEDVEPFYPDRMANRILGMGDMLSLIEQAQANFDEEQAIKMEKKLRTQQFDLEDFLEQFQQVRKMGGVADLIKKLPGGLANKVNADDVDERQMYLSLIHIFVREVGSYGRDLRPFVPSQIVDRVSRRLRK